MICSSALGVARMAHGLTVAELTRERVGSPWEVVVGGARNRRYLIDTEYAFTGPAAGSPLLVTSEHPDGMTTQGTLGNCSGGTTPWGTVLTGEENFPTYFRTAATAPEDLRYGLKNAPRSAGWEVDEPRFDTRNAGFENSHHHFGWIVEYDPTDPTSIPRKHTGLGRLKHEGANIHIDATNHVVAYMGDDEVFDYLYKFVSSKTYIEGDRAHNMTLLDEGNLYVAQFTGDSAGEIDGTGAVPADGNFNGTGTWLPLIVDGESVIAGMTADQVAVFTRLASDIAGATKMDRCEDVQPSPTTGKVYVACTNNSRRGTAGLAVADEMNPRNENRDGHIVELTEAGDDVTATTFTWNLLLVCGDPAVDEAAYFSGFPADQVSPISCPDNVAFDSVGNLWITTDGAPSSIGFNDGLFKVTLDGAERGKVEQFLSVPRDAEACGPVIHDDEGHVFVAVQHPGEDGTFEEPTSFFPDYFPTGGATTGGQRMRGPHPRLAANGPAFNGPRPTIVQVLLEQELEPIPTPEPTTTTPTSTPTTAPATAESTATTRPGGGTTEGADEQGTSNLAETGAGGGLIGAALGSVAAIGAGLAMRRSRAQQPQESESE